MRLLLGGPDRKIIDSTGREWLFNDHPRLGPIPLTQTGNSMSREPGPRSPFWKAVNNWYSQGKSIADDVCIWQEPEPEGEVRKIDGRYYLVEGV